MKSRLRTFFSRYYDDAEALSLSFIVVRTIAGLSYEAMVLIFWKLNVIDYDPSLIIFKIIPAYLVINILWLFLRKIKAPRWIILDSQLFLDIIFITLIIHSSGGPHSDMFFLYVFPVVSATLIAPFTPLTAGLTAIFFYGLLLYLEHTGIITPVSGPHFGFQNDEKIRLGIFTLLISVLAFQTTYLMGRVKNQEDKIMKAKDEFISIVSHQLRTPVVSIKWLMELYKKMLPSNQDEKQTLALSQIFGSIDRLNQLVGDLLDLSKIQLGKNIKTIQEINLGDSIANFIKDLPPYSADKTKKIVFNPKETLSITTDPKMLYDILGNLVTNALKYSPPDSQITIDFKKEGNFARISVANQGPPIPAEAQKHLFEKFFRGESAVKVEPGGTGLGLYIVKTFVEYLGGKVGFRSGINFGTEFWFTLPIKHKNK